MGKAEIFRLTPPPDEPLRQEAQCPECDAWSAVEVVFEGTQGGWWWANDDGDGGCPKCGALICVESECAFRAESVLGQFEYREEKQRP